MLRRALFAFLFALVAPAAWSQTPAPPRVPTAQLPPDSLFAQRLRLADRLMAQRQVPDAIALLETLANQRPNDVRTYVRLASAYRVAERYTDALALYERLQKDAPTPFFDLQRAELRALTGDTAQARLVWKQLLTDRPTDAELSQVLPSMIASGQPAMALSMLNGLPAAARRAPSVQRATAHLVAALGDAPRSARLYLDVLDDDPSQALVVQDSLVRLARTSTVRDALRAAVDERIERTARRRSGQALFENEGDRQERRVRLKALYSIAATLALAGADGSAATAHVRALDALDGQDGRVLIRFARAALDAQVLGAADSLYAAALARYPRTDAARDALLGRADMAEREAVQLGETALAPATAAGRAAQLLAQFAEAFPQHPATADALARLGRLLVDGGDPAAADRVLADVQRRYPRQPAADDAAYDAARLLVRTGRVDEAARAFDALATRLGTGYLADRARFEQATALLFLQRFDDAATLLGDLADRATSDVANDALDLSLLVREARTDSVSADLGRYARALLRLRQGRAAEAADSLSVLAVEMLRSGYAPVLDDVLARRADAIRQTGNAVFAAEAYDDLARRFPRSIHADAALLALADLYAGPLRDDASAIGALERLIEEHPASLLADDARDRLLHLRSR